MNKESAPVASSPSKASWVVASSSTILLLAVLYLGEAVSTGYHYAKLHKSLVTSLTPESDLSFVVDNPNYSDLFQADSRQLKNLRPLILLINQNDSKSALTYVKRQDMPNTPMYSQLKKALASLVEVSEASDSQTAEIEKAKALSALTKQEYEGLRSRFEAFLSGRIGLGSKSAEAGVVFYESGLLAGLPVIEALPDDIDEIKDLSRYYSLARKGEQPPTAEMAKKSLDALKSEGLAIQSAYNRAVLDRDRIENEASDSRERKAALTHEAKELLRNLLVDYAKPDIDERTYDIYQAFCKTAESWGYQPVRLDI